jgi:nucleotide-binding universal stress UspA family protein
VSAPEETTMPAIRTILVPSDLSPEAGHALEHASVLAGKFAATLTLYHSVPLPDHAYAHWAFSHNSEVWSELEREARVALVESAARLGHQACAKVERATSVPRALIAFILDTRPDLVVMATHGRGGVEHLLLGSVTEQVFRSCHRPVLCVRRTAHESGLPYRRILVPTDLSPASRLAFPRAAELGRVFDAEILAVHVRHTSAATLAGVPGDALVPTEAYLWDFCRRDFEGLSVTAQVHSGGVWDRIVETARVERADLIVMGTRGHDSLMDRMIGSNTERVVRHAPCPVLVA